MKQIFGPNGELITIDSEGNAWSSAGGSGRVYNDRIEMLDGRCLYNHGHDNMVFGSTHESIKLEQESSCSSASSDDTGTFTDAGIVVLMGLALWFTEANGITDIIKDKPETLVTRPYYSPLPVTKSSPLPVYVEEQKFDISDLYSDFMKYDNMKVLFSDFIDTRYALDRSRDPSTGKARLSGRDIEMSITRSYYDAIDGRGFRMSRSSFDLYIENFRSALRTELLERHATDSEIEIVIRIIDANFNQKIAERIGANFISLPDLPIQNSLDTDVPTAELEISPVSALDDPNQVDTTLQILPPIEGSPLPAAAPARQYQPQ